jgi:hypothetical protein
MDRGKPVPPSNEIPATKIEVALVKTGGNIAQAAALVPCEPSTIRRRVNRDEHLADVLETARGGKVPLGGPPSRPVVQYTDEQIAAALKVEGGFISRAARRLGCSVATITKRKKKSEAIRDAIEEHRETTIDVAEDGLRQAVLNREPWAIKLVLMTLGKKRGYTESLALTGAEGSPAEIVVQFVRPRDA